MTVPPLLEQEIAVQKARLHAAEDHERVMLNCAVEAEQRWKTSKEQREAAFTQYGRLLEERARFESERVVEG